MIFEDAIDAHVHLWDPGRQDDILVLSKQPHLGPFGDRAHLTDFLSAGKVSGAILVQSAPSQSHSDWLRQAGRDIPGVAGVVGWIDPFHSAVEAEIEALKQDPLACGIRLMLNRMPRIDALRTPRALAALARVVDAGLAIECLCPAQLLPATATLAKALPSASIVLDHCGLPPARRGDLELWDRGLLALSALPNVTTKFSGLIESFGPEVALADIEGRALRTVDLFGPDRLMAASNFPVAELGGGQGRWADLLSALLERAQFTPEERQAVLRDTAISAYALAPPT